jgi:hypothetical protein
VARGEYEACWGWVQQGMTQAWLYGSACTARPGCDTSSQACLNLETRRMSLFLSCVH